MDTVGENKYNFQKLTPIDSADLKIYQDAIDYVFDNSDIRNVAISGAYGAGKSSTLESYKGKNPNHRFLHISLAHFQLVSENEDSEGIEREGNEGYDEKIKEVEKDIKDATLEGKILNQLIHQIPPDKIPQTNFKVKRKAEQKGSTATAVLILTFIIFLLHLIFFSAWNKYVGLLTDSCVKSVLKFFANPYSLLGSAVICIWILYIFMQKVITVQKNRNVFRKISFQGNEIEIFEDSKESYFDKYLNEVLYLFENAEADVIVFEDVDRFNVNQIFERLREINTLVNIQLVKEAKKPLRFFYLLRDDIFISKDRTKFFDYIIPIVPVVDSSNSYDQFIACFEEGGIVKKFETKFLQNLSLYVDDMRILKNIYNEFCIYYNCLNTIELDCNKMLAIVTYKNIFPRDFSDLQLNKGFVYALFAQKESFINDEIEELQKLSEDKQEEIQGCKNEHLTSIQELKDVYEKKHERLYNNRQIRNSEEQVKREQAINNMLNGKLSELENQMHQLEQEIIKIQSKPLQEIINRRNVSEIFKITVTNEVNKIAEFKEIKGSDYFELLKYLIWNGYIDETYADYMTYFYENSLNRIDKIFLRSITDKKAKEYTYKLKNIRLVVERLSITDFDQEEILNFDLLEYLLQDPNQKAYLQHFIEQLEKTRNFEFVGTYLDTKRQTSAYVNTVNLYWKDFFSEASEREGVLSERQLCQYSIFTLYYCDNEIISDVNGETECLTQYISEREDFLDMSNPKINKLIEAFNLLEISFVHINSEKANKELFEAVYKESLYEINFANIVLMVNNFYCETSIEKLQHQNCTVVCLQPESSLKEYLWDNIETYIKVVLDNCDDKITDSEDVVIELLNNEEISIQSRMDYMEKLQTVVFSLDQIVQKVLWDALLNKEVVMCTPENIITYYQQCKETNQILINFINTDESILDFSQTMDQYGEEDKESLFNSIIVCDELKDKKYQEIITSLGFYCEEFENTGIADEKLKILIDTNIIRMTTQTLVFMRNHYESLSLHFIARNIEKYLELMTVELFSINELKIILSWDIDDNIKISLLEFTKEPISIVDKGYSSAIKRFILTNNIQVSDIAELFEVYDNLATDVKEKVLEIAEITVTHLTIQPFNIAKSLLKRILASPRIAIESRVLIFAVTISRFEKEEYTEILDMLSLSEYKKLLLPRTRPSFKKNAVNEKLLTAFVAEHVIYKFEDDENKPGFYKVVRRSGSTKTLPTELL